MDFKFNVIFNSAQQSRRNPTADAILALEFVKLLIAKMNSFGIRGYNPDKDARLGASIYKEHFRIVKETDWTLVIVTPGFFADYWADYKNEAAFNYLKRDGQRHKLIPIAVHTTDLREIDVNVPLFFTDRTSWHDENKWITLKNMMLGKHENSYRTSDQPVQALNDNTPRTDRQCLITRPVSQACSLSSLAENSLDAGAECLGLDDNSNNNRSVFALSHSEGIPNPRLSFSPLQNLPNQNARAEHNHVTAGHVSIDGPRSNDAPQNGSVDTNCKEEACVVDDPTSANRQQQNELNGDEELTRALDDTPSLNPDSLTDDGETQVAHQTDCKTVNAHMSGIIQESNELKITNTHKTDSQNDEDLYGDAQQPLIDQSHGQKRDDEMQGQKQIGKEFAIGQTQRQEKDSNIKRVADCNTDSNVEGSGQGQQRLETAKSGVDVEKQCVPDKDNVNATSGSAVNSTSMKHLKIADQYDAGDYDGTGVKERFHTLQSDGNSQRESTDQLNDDDLDVDYQQSTIIQSQSVDVENRGVPDGDDSNTTSRSSLETSMLHMKHIKIANQSDDDNDETAVKEGLQPLRSDGAPLNLDIDCQQSSSKQSRDQGHGEVRELDEIMEQNESKLDTTEPSADGASGFLGIAGKVLHGSLRFVKYMFESDKVYN